MDRDSAKSYIKQTKLNSKIDKKHVVDGKVLVSTQQSQSQYDGIRSAIVLLYTLTHIAVPSDFDKEMKTYIAGLQQTGIKEKQQLGLKLSEGKKPITQAAFKFLAKSLFISDKKEDIFLHLFLTLDW